MTDAVKDIAPVKQMDQLQAALTAQLKAEPNKPLVLYVSGKEADGTSCSACVRFEKDQRAVLDKHKKATHFEQAQVLLDFNEFKKLASIVGATVDVVVDANGKPSAIFQNATTGARGELATPMLLELGLDADGKLQVKAVANGGGNLDRLLSDFERMGKAQTQAASAVTPGCMVNSTSTACPIDPNYLKNLQQKSNGQAGPNR